MNRLISIPATIALSICTAQAGLPKIAALKPGETLSVSMRLYGYTITGADFLFSSDKVVVKPLNGKAGDLVLTAEEKAKVDGFLERVQKARKRNPADEGFEYSIKYFKVQQPAGAWNFPIDDVDDSKKTTLSLYELKNRVEKQQAKEVESGNGQPAAAPEPKSEGSGKAKSE